MRWCTNFVEPLKLCPWTSGSISTPGAISIHVVVANKETDLMTLELSMASAIRDAALYLKQKVETNVASPNTAIAFVIALDVHTTLPMAWEFCSFYDWFVTYEDGLLQEADGNEVAIGNYVTIAPFHCQWEFALQDETEKALFFEKKSPFPTVSIVCTSEIDKAGPQVTRQIGICNEQVLTEMGVADLQRIYHENVLLRRPTEQSNNYRNS